MKGCFRVFALSCDDIPDRGGLRIVVYVLCFG